MRPWCPSSMQYVSFEIYGVFDGDTRREFRLRGGEEGGHLLAATKTMLALNPVYHLYSKGEEVWEGRYHDQNSDMSGRSVEVEKHRTDS